MAQAAEALTNQPTFDDDAVIAVNLSKIRTAQDNAASHHGSLRNVLKHAEGKGVHLKAAKRALSIVKAGDPDAWLEENQAVTRYLRILRHGLQESQLKLFEFETTLAPIDERAGLDGRAAGLQGDTEASNPHADNTKAGQAWLTAYRQGLSERELILAMKDEEADSDDADEGDED
jgi:hypothetical protein